MAPRFVDFVSSSLPCLFSHLLAAFNTVRVICGSLFVMFATTDLQSVFLLVCSVGLECCFWSQPWALVSRGWASEAKKRKSCVEECLDGKEKRVEAPSRQSGVN